MNLANIVHKFADLPAAEVYEIVNSAVEELLHNEDTLQNLQPISTYLQTITTKLSTTDAALALGLVRHNTQKELTHFLLTDFGLKKFAPIKDTLQALQLMIIDRTESSYILDQLLRANNLEPNEPGRKNLRLFIESMLGTIAVTLGKQTYKTDKLSHNELIVAVVKNLRQQRESLNIKPMVTKFPNQCSIYFTNITVAEDILVITYNKNAAPTKATIAYYSSEAFAKIFNTTTQNCQNLNRRIIEVNHTISCPLTRNSQYVAIPLATLNQEQLLSLIDQHGYLIEGRLGKHVNSYALEYFLSAAENCPIAGKHLLLSGDSCQMQKVYGFTSLMLAIYRGDIAAVEQLLATKLDLTIKSTHGFNALELAQKEPRDSKIRVQIIKQLILKIALLDVKQQANILKNIHQGSYKNIAFYVLEKQPQLLPSLIATITKCENRQSRLQQLFDTTNNKGETWLNLAIKASKTAQVAYTLTPYLIKDANKFKQLLHSLSVAQRSAIYEAMQPHLLTIITNAHTMSYILRHLTADQCFQVCTNVIKNLPDLISTVKDVATIVKFLSLEQKQAIYKAIANNLLSLSAQLPANNEEGITPHVWSITKHANDCYVLGNSFGHGLFPAIKIYKNNDNTFDVESQRLNALAHMHAKRTLAVNKYIHSEKFYFWLQADRIPMNDLTDGTLRDELQEINDSYPGAIKDVDALCNTIIDSLDNNESLEVTMDQFIKKINNGKFYAAWRDLHDKKISPSHYYVDFAYHPPQYNPSRISYLHGTNQYQNSSIEPSYNINTYIYPLQRLIDKCLLGSQGITEKNLSYLPLLLQELVKSDPHINPLHYLLQQLQRTGRPTHIAVYYGDRWQPSLGIENLMVLKNLLFLEATLKPLLTTLINLSIYTPHQLQGHMQELLQIIKQNHSKISYAKSFPDLAYKIAIHSESNAIENTSHLSNYYSNTLQGRDVKQKIIQQYYAYEAFLIELLEHCISCGATLAPNVVLPARNFMQKVHQVLKDNKDTSVRAAIVKGEQRFKYSQVINTFFNQGPTSQDATDNDTSSITAIIDGFLN